jgi:hypothetical protein
MKKVFVDCQNQIKKLVWSDMRKILLLLATVSLSLNISASSSGPSRRFYPQGTQDSLGSAYGFKDLVIFSLIAKRCRRYLPQEHLSCKDAVAVMLEELDTDVIFPQEEKQLTAPGSFLFVAFKNYLIRFLSDKQTQNYLESLNREINDYLVGLKPSFNLWSHSLKFYRHEKLAAMAIATLFQDTTNARLHLAYLERTGTRTGLQFDKNLELLHQTISNLNTLMDLQDQKYIELFYPQNTADPINRNFYHFYVPLYLRHALKDLGISSKMSSVAPFMMTITYEFLTASDDYRYAFADPERLTDEDLWKMKDIFAGYQGAYISKSQAPLKSFKYIQESFKNSTAKTIQALLSSDLK